MEAFALLRQQIHDILSRLNSSLDDKTSIVKELATAALNICLSFDQKSQLLNDNLHKKNDRLIETLHERNNLMQELNQTKDSARAIIKCLNMSLETSSHIIARTIIEMIAREKFHTITLDITKLMDTFCREKKYLHLNLATVDLLKEAKKRSFWSGMTEQQQKNADLFIKWYPHMLNKKNFLPTNDLLKIIWDQAKSKDIVMNLKHLKFGVFSDTQEHIEDAFINLYKTLSEADHNSGICYEGDILPIPDLIDNVFNKFDALALASFYSITLPHMKYGIISNVGDLLCESSYWLNNVDLKDHMNTFNPANEECNKRKKNRN